MKRVITWFDAKIGLNCWLLFSLFYGEWWPKYSFLSLFYGDPNLAFLYRVMYNDLILGFLFTQKENAFHVSTSFHEKLVSQQIFLNKFTKQDPRRISRKIFSNRIIYDEVNRKLDEEALLIITGWQKICKWSKKINEAGIINWNGIFTDFYRTYFIHLQYSHPEVKNQ